MYRLWTRHRSGTEAISVYVGGYGCIGLGMRLWVYRPLSG